MFHTSPCSTAGLCLPRLQPLRQDVWMMKRPRHPALKGVQGLKALLDFS
jgi:hypothetical protein